MTKALDRPCGACRRQRGLTMVEVMIALLIGMLTIMVVVNLMSNYSSQQRSARAVDDAQMNALLGLYAMEQDLRKAGYGLATDELQNCTTLFSYFGNSLGTLPAPVANFGTAAVTIVDGGAGPDTVVVRYAESTRSVWPAALSANMSSPNGNLTVSTPFGFRTNGLVLVVNSAGQCALRQITGAIPTSAPFTLVAASTGAATFNPPNTVATSTPVWPTFTSSNSRVYALDALTLRQYSLTAGGLVARNINAASDTGIAADIVDLQAQYGVSASAGSTTITQWVNATGGWATPSVTDRKRIRAVRLALVARGTEQALADVSPATIELWPVATTGQTSAVQTFTVPDRRLRYRVLRTVIPMKNMLWATLS